MYAVTCRLVALVAVVFVSAVPAQSQDVPPSPTHRLPFGSRGNALELVVGASGGAALAVVVAEAPPWLAFESPRAAAVVPDGAGEPVARLTFDVSVTAPAGEAGEIVLNVVDASGAVVAEHTVRVEAEAPRELSISPPRPNPSAGAVVVGYAVPDAGRVRVIVFDALGRAVLTLADDEAAPGGYEARIPAGRLAAGAYVVRVVAGGEARVARLTVVR